MLYVYRIISRLQYVFRIVQIYNLNCYHFSLCCPAEHVGACRSFNKTSPLAASYVQVCNSNDDIDEYECRKLVISYRSVDTYFRRDCVPKGLCSWKDKTQSMINTPISDCVYTDVKEGKLECIYCCDTPLCNRTIRYEMTTIAIIFGLMCIHHWWKKLFS